MKKYIIIGILVLMGLSGFSQQDPHYSMYMFNGLVLNPAYAGSKEHVSSTFIYRKQWVGFDGSPSTASFGIHGPSRNLKHGFGLSFVNDKIGVSTDMALNAIYSYRIHLNETARLSFGLQGQLRNFRAGYNGVRTDQSGDIAFSDNDVNLWHPNVGAGVYFNTNRVYLGASVSSLVPNQLNDAAKNLTAQRYMDYMATGGVVLDLGPSVKFKPSFLMTWNPAAPIEFDLNGSFLFVEKFWLGASYRTQDAVVLMAEWNITKALRLGYAYDLSTSAIKSYNSGSHELMLGFDFNFDRHSMISPRYF